jgi:glyoxylase-like metal-dependent hydrolase (beta-lactamase superfamily II)
VGVLIEIVEGVLVRQSAFCLSNAVVIRDRDSALLVDPGVDGDDLEELAEDLEVLGTAVTVGFATHPHWDHVLWHYRFGADTPRFGTAACAAATLDRLAKLREMTASNAPGAPLELVGGITAVAAAATHLPWPGPRVRLVEHQAHAPGHAALVVEGTGALIAGDMLSDVEIPLLDPRAADPCGDYLVALDLLEAIVSGGVTTAIPGHGSVARGPEVRSRIDADRRYVLAIVDGTDPADPRVGSGADYGTDWLPEAHERNVRLAAR